MYRTNNDYIAMFVPIPLFIVTPIPQVQGRQKKGHSQANRQISPLSTVTSLLLALLFLLRFLLLLRLLFRGFGDGELVCFVVQPETVTGDLFVTPVYLVLV